ncbi:hypothetical protein BaRGS_00040077, partial [Batillaria attramentaria]
RCWTRRPQVGCQSIVCPLINYTPGSITSLALQSSRHVCPAMRLEWSFFFPANPRAGFALTAGLPLEIWRRAAEVCVKAEREIKQKGKLEAGGEHAS